MLDDVERQRLSEIDAWFQSSDPRLARRFAQGPRRWTARPGVTVLVVLVALAVAILAGGALDGPPAAIEGGLIVLAITAGCWLQNRQAQTSS